MQIYERIIRILIEQRLNEAQDAGQKLGKFLKLGMLRLKGLRPDLGLGNKTKPYTDPETGQRPPKRAHREVSRFLANKRVGPKGELIPTPETPMSIALKAKKNRERKASEIRGHQMISDRDDLDGSPHG